MGKKVLNVLIIIVCSSIYGGGSGV